VSNAAETLRVSRNWTMAKTLFIATISHELKTAISPPSKLEPGNCSMDERIEYGQCRADKTADP
jgi:hypothetical protein